jgi:hypothetical protein
MRFRINFTVVEVLNNFNIKVMATLNKESPCLLEQFIKSGLIYASENTHWVLAATSLYPS